MGKLSSDSYKGRIWISSTSFDVLRIETACWTEARYSALRGSLLVTMPHEISGPFNTILWLPLERGDHRDLRGHLYHHSTIGLTTAFLKGPNHKIGKAENVPAPFDPGFSPRGDATSLN